MNAQFVEFVQADLEFSTERPGHWLERMRNEAGLSLRELSQLSGVSHANIWRIERGGNSNVGTILRLTNAMYLDPLPFFILAMNEAKR